MATGADGRTLPRARLTPAALPLMHATLADAVPAGSEWLYELKWDGVRVLALRVAGEVRLYTRNGVPVTMRYPEVVAALAELGGGDLALDGEIVALDPEGVPSFDRLQRRMHLASVTAARAAARTVPATAYVFDCLALAGRDVRRLPLHRRKALLKRLLRRRTAALRYCDHIARGGAQFLASVRAAGLEGIVAKRAGSAYRSGRHPDWRKIKCTLEQEFVIGGHTEPGGTRRGLGALHLGVHEDGVLVYVGRVGSGFSERTLGSLTARLRSLATARCPFAPGGVPRGSQHHWVRPELVCTVRFSAWTRDGLLRQPVFRGLRSEVSPSAVRRERPVD